MKRFVKDIKGLVSSSVGLSAGSMVLGGMGSYGVGGQTALSKATPMLGVLGVASGASAVMRAIPKVKGKKKSRW